MNIAASLADQIIKTDKRRRLVSLAQSHTWQMPRRELWWWLGLVLSLAVLVSRQAYLQIVQGKFYQQLAEEQRIRLLALPAARGIVYDRDEQPLVRNLPLNYQVRFDPKLGQVWQPVSEQEAIKLRVAGGNQVVISAASREYLYPEALAHVLGYVGQVSAQELKQDHSQDACPERFTAGNLIGRAGVERSYDCRLRGINGKYLVEVDSRGQLVREIGSQAPISGESLQLNLDLGLQQEAWAALQDKTGAVVALDPRNGAVLALVSSPGFNSNWFSPHFRFAYPKLSQQQISQVLQSPDTPLLNRTLAATYPPGSVFKLVTTVAGIDSQTITRQYTYVDKGYIERAGFTYRNWLYIARGGTEGRINIVRALARSTDTFYYQLGEMLGPDTLAEYARQLGLGNKTGIDLPGEVSGLVPDPAWKERVKGERWYLGNTYHLAIGQGDVLVTPVQASRLTATVMTGKRCQPQVVQQSVDCQTVDLSPEALQTVWDGMVAACSPGGTAALLFDFQPQLACKTGTAEFGPRDEFGKRKTHSWLTAAGPMIKTSEGWQLDLSNNPIVVTAVVEAGGEGSGPAAQVVKQVLERWQEE